MDCPAGLNLRCAKIVWLDSCFLVRIRLSRPLFFAADPPCPGPPPPICPGPEKVLLPRLSQAAAGPAARPPACAGRPGGNIFAPHPPFLCKERRRHCGQTPPVKTFAAQSGTGQGNKSRAIRFWRSAGPNPRGDPYRIAPLVFTHAASKIAGLGRAAPQRRQLGMQCKANHCRHPAWLARWFQKRFVLSCKARLCRACRACRACRFPSAWAALRARPATRSNCRLCGHVSLFGSG